jgi:RimJ/RimL family protein N-acetyltransferase
MSTNRLSPEAFSRYQAAVVKEFAGQKQINQFDELVARSIRLEDHKGYLMSVSELHADDVDMITMLAKWRSEATTFHDGFKVTFDGTKNWLRKLLLDIPDRILFLVLNRYGKPIGHLGFANAMNDQGLMEVDNVIRGVHGAEPGLMSLSIQALLRWAVQTISPQGFHLKTLEDNVHAIGFYDKLGFKFSGKLPLRRVEKDGVIKFVPQSEDDKGLPDKQYVCMDYDPQSAAQASTPNNQS